jgi:hypothetical protein
MGPGTWETTRCPQTRYTLPLLRHRSLVAVFFITSANLVGHPAQPLVRVLPSQKWSISECPQPQKPPPPHRPLKTEDPDSKIAASRQTPTGGRLSAAVFCESTGSARIPSSPNTKMQVMREGGSSRGGLLPALAIIQAPDDYTFRLVQSLMTRPGTTATARPNQPQDARQPAKPTIAPTS